MLKQIFFKFEHSNTVEPGPHGYVALDDLVAWFTDKLRPGAITRSELDARVESAEEAHLENMEKSRLLNLEQARLRELAAMHTEYMEAQRSSDPLTMQEFWSKYDKEQFEELRTELQREHRIRQDNERLQATGRTLGRVEPQSARADAGTV